MKRTYCFDLDGTLCTNTWGDYESAQPFPWAVDRVTALKQAGHRVLVFTARGGTTGIDWRPTTEAQLRKWGVQYDELIFGKPDADVYVDDRTVHVDSWRYGDAVMIDAGSAEAIPVLPPPRSATVVEVGRTFGGHLLYVDRHSRRGLAIAAAHDVPTVHTAEQIAAAVALAVEPSRELLAPDDDIVYTIALAGPPHAAYADTIDGEPTPSLTIGCRLLSQAADGFRRYAHDGGVAWPLHVSADGTAADPLGGDLISVHAGTLRGRRADAGVALERTLELAQDRGYDTEEAQPTWEGADELLVAAMPFCLLRVSTVAGRTFRPGAVSDDLFDAWRESTGIDIRAQLRP